MSEDHTTMTPERVSEKHYVDSWVKKIVQAKSKFHDDFTRMRKDMEFVSGFQSEVPRAILDPNYDHYQSNFTLHLIKQKVAQLYARDPKVRSQRRRRLEFRHWDGRMDSLQSAVSVMQATEGKIMGGQPATPDDQTMVIGAKNLMEDYARGRRERDLIDRIGRTMEILFLWMRDHQEPTFKLQVKQMVQRALVTGVGYVRATFVEGDEDTLDSGESETTMKERLDRVDYLLDKIDREGLEEDRPEHEELRALKEAIRRDSVKAPSPVTQRISFTFPASTSIIVDPSCRSLKGFVGAHWLAQEHVLTVEYVNAHFKLDPPIRESSGIKLYAESGEADKDAVQVEQKEADFGKSRIIVWEIFDIDTKQSFTIAEGYGGFLSPPSSDGPVPRRFWPVVALSFNDTEIDPWNQRATIYPPSDVDILRPIQMEWNRCRESLRDHRIANAPKYFTFEGKVTDDDARKIEAGLPNEIIKIQGSPAEDIGKVFQKFQPVEIDPRVYDTSPLSQDIGYSTGMEYNLRPPGQSTKGTATAATIQAQQQIVGVSSNVDDLDTCLDELANMVGEMMLLGMDKQTVEAIVGPGAAWPELKRETFIDMLYLETVAASSGRPNKAADIASLQQLAPLWLQCGVSPRRIAELLMKSYDETIEIDDLFPAGPPPPPQPLVTPGQRRQVPSPSPRLGTIAPTPQGQFPAQTNPTFAPGS